MARASKSGKPLRLVAFLATPLGRGLAKGVAVAVGVLVLALVVRKARAGVERMDAYRLRAADVTFAGLPDSVDEDVRKGLEAFLPPVWPASPPSVFSRGVEARLRDALSHHPMLREVAEVEARFPREVRVRATVRTPIAAFRTTLGVADGRLVDADVPVDGDGVVLDPTTYATFLATHDVVRVLGVRATCPAIGRPWIDSDEQTEEALAAARVANRLNAERVSIRLPKVTWIDVAGFPAPPTLRARGEVILLLEDGRVVQWGRTERDLAGAPHEDGFATKRDRLVALLSAPEARPRRELDVRFSVAPPPSFAPLVPR
jgi:hypothetical protein